jgi:UDP-glucuronate 4-epimerase
MKIFITGIAGMIGYHTAIKFKSMGHDVSGIDHFNDYYGTSLKFHRSRLLNEADVSIAYGDAVNSSVYDELWVQGVPDVVIHLASYAANPRHSVKNPRFYVDNDIKSTMELISSVERFKINRVVYASSSCVYYGHDILKLPWKENDSLSWQTSPYGWSKWVDECQFVNIRSAIGLRFFTAYGPLGRPDMALFKFMSGILNGDEIQLYGNGELYRDFVYVEDIAETVYKVALGAPLDSKEIYNVGTGRSVKINDVLHMMEEIVGKKANNTKCIEIPSGDVQDTIADVSKLSSFINYSPSTNIEHGLLKFTSWYKEHYE